MKSFSFVFAFLITSLICHGQSEIETKKFSPTELKEDLGYLFSKLENIHPSLYHYTPKQRVDEKRIGLEKELDHPMTRMEFARKVIPLVSMLKDAHTSVGFPSEERATLLNNGGKVFPLNVLINENKIFVTSDYSSDSIILPSTEILSINGIQSIAVLEKLRSFISAELDFYRDERIQRAFRRMLWYAYGWEGDYDLQVSVNGEVVSKKIHGMTEKDLNNSYQRKGLSLTGKPFSYYTLESKIGVLDFRSMNNLERFTDFLDSTFTVIQKNNIHHLVIDIRNNGGGDSKLGEALFNYITDKSYKQFERVEIKNSLESGRVKNKNSRKNGTITVIDNVPLKTPKKRFNKFRGTTYLLTSHITFSSANAFANAFKCYKMGVIIGEETGGVLSPYGDLIEVTLPNTQLKGFCSHKKFVYPCADDTLHGVKPDVEIVPTMEDIQNRKDPAMEYVIKAVKNDN